MRYNAYEFNDDDYVQILKSPASEWVIPSNTKPYQKIQATNYYNLEYQMPAYFMQYISFAMKTDLNILGIDVPHPKFVDLIVHGGGFWKAKFSGVKTTSTKDKIITSKPLIETPHFLESYYLITKKISVLDFN